MRFSPLLVLLTAMTTARPVLAHGKSHSAGADGGIVALDVSARGSLVDLLTVRSIDKEPHLEHQRSTDGGKTWSPVHPIPLREPAYQPSRGTDPQIIANDEGIVALWTSKGDTKYGDGPLVGAASTDGGLTWRPIANPADDKSQGGHGFIDLLADQAGRIHAIWLDSRDGAQGLRYSSTADKGVTWSKNETMDNRTCECCWNRLYELKDGTFATLYRDRDPRDMALETRAVSASSWQRLSTVGAFDWKFEGCPHVGGALAQTCSGSSCALHALVWTGKEGQAGLYHLASTDAGKTWSAPRLMGQPEARHADIASVDNRLIALWDEVAGGKRQIFGSESTDGGKTWSKGKQLSTPDVMATHPRVVATSLGFIAFWTEARPKQLSAWRSTILPAHL